MLPETSSVRQTISSLHLLLLRPSPLMMEVLTTKSLISVVTSVAGVVSPWLLVSTLGCRITNDGEGDLVDLVYV